MQKTTLKTRGNPLFLIERVLINMIRLMNFEFGESSAHTEARTRQQALKFATQILGNLKNFTGLIVRIIS